MPVPLLPRILSDALLAVEVAWGADLTAASSTWNWSDITTDVRLEQRIKAKVGAADEAATTQPAKLGLTLDNTAERYSHGGMSPNWPYVRQGTPVRVRIRPSAAASYATVFFGYADTWEPNWNLPGTDATVALTASGLLRRLLQNTDPLISVLRRKLTADPTVVAYWSCEDGKDADQFTSDLPDGQPMRVTVGSANFAAYSDFVGSGPVPTLRNDAWDGAVTPYANTGEWQARFLAAFPDSGIPDHATILRVYTSHSGVAAWDLRYGTGGSLRLVAVNIEGATVFDSGALGFTVDGRRFRLSVDIADSGPGFAWQVGAVDLDTIVGSLVDGDTGSLASHGPVTRVIVNKTVNITGLSPGHLVVHKEIQDFFSDLAQLTAWRGDTPLNRIERLCVENAIPFNWTGSGSDDHPLDKLGPQPIDALVPLLRDAETTGLGSILYDGGMMNTSPSPIDGLVFIRRYYRENRAPRFTVDAAALQLAPPFVPTNDDQNRLNRAEAQRRDGGTAVAEDTTGPLGTNAVGIYSGSETFGSMVDDTMPHYAAWMVHQGTVQGYRYPKLVVDLAATPALAPAATGVLGLTPGDRVDVANIRSALPQFPRGTVDLAVAGWEHTIGQDTWTVELNCGPYEPWRIAVLAATTGDTGEFLARLDTDGSSLAADAGQGASSLSVAHGVFEDFEDTALAVTLAAGGTAGWSRTNTQAQAGSWSLRSGVITHSQTSDAVITLPPGTVTLEFWFRVSSESGFDHFQLLVDGVQVGSNSSGTIGWTFVAPGTFDLRGASTITFRYTKDASTSTGEDAAYIDGLRLIPDGPLWTTTADDFPLVVDVAGIPVTVTNITGGSSPQTFTVDPGTVTKPLPSGSTLAVHRPPALAL